jgi:hypothetical protein
MNSSEAEVLEWFPDGNWDDYWLGTPSRNPAINTNSFLDEDQGGWRSAEIVLREMIVDAPSDETLFLMRAPGKPEGGGVTGLDEEYHPVLTGLLKAGERALEEERRARRVWRR